MNTKLQYHEAAQDWFEALPMGNGRIGAMVYGRPQDEIICLNEDTLWAGRYCDRGNYAGTQHLENVRSLIFQGAYKEAHREIIDTILGGESFPYLPLGSLELHLRTAEVTDYHRALDLRCGLSQVFFRSGGSDYRREVLVSQPDQVLAIHQTCSRSGGVTMTIRLRSPLHHTLVNGDQELILDGLCPSEGAPEADPTRNPFTYTDDGIRFNARVRLQTKGGTVRVLSDAIEVHHADEAVIFFCVRSNFKKYNLPLAQDYSCAADLQRAVEKGYDAIRRDHIADAASLFDRVDLRLGSMEDTVVDTDKMVYEFTKTGQYAAELAELKFHFGRYLLIACSRPGTQPANLQGIWNRKLRAKWSSNYTLNVNTEMNYALAPMFRLEECQEPLDRMISELAEEGSITARKLYGLPGWVAHHNTDLWRLTTPVGHIGEQFMKLAQVTDYAEGGPVRWGMWPMGGVWLCRRIWDRYSFTMDRDYLQRMYPKMKGAAEFMLGFLVEHNGYLVTCPSTSPENEFRLNGSVYSATYGTTADNALLRDLFTLCLNVQDILGHDELYDRLQEALRRLPPYRIGKFGQIMEWPEDFEETEVPHRHLSHLYGFYPAHQMPEELEPAVRRTMERRGDRACAWEASWRAAVWATLKDGEHAFRALSRQMTLSDASDEIGGQGGIYVNLLDNYPPFQIDGVLGFPVAVREMLVQDHNGVLELLPALPAAWANGTLTHFPIRGGAMVSVTWKDSAVVCCTLESNVDQVLSIRFNGTSQTVHLKAGVPTVIIG